jgi:hypothetical protein
MRISSIIQKGMIVSLVVYSVAASAQKPRWSSHTYAVGGNPAKAVVADVNGDGIVDLVVALPDVPEVAVLLGNKNGTFQSPKYSPYDGGDIAVADFTGDHKLDLATPERLYSGSGDGYFHYTSILPKSGTLVLEDDFNKDGHADVAVIDLDIWTLLGNGHGDFTVKELSGYTTSNNYTVASWFSTDLNGDGIPDLVIQEEENFGSTSGPNTSIHVEMRKGGGTFTAAPSLSDQFSAFIPYGITGLGDVNGDKKLDLVVTGGDGVHTYFGKGNGSFQPFVSSGSSTECGPPFAMGDLNGDGRADLLCDNNGQETFYSSNGDGSYKKGTVFALDSNGVGTNGVVIADLNQDGTKDAILLDLSGSATSSITVLLNLSGTEVPVSTTPATLVYKEPFSLSAPVTASVKQTPHPSGSVAYKDGTTTLGSSTLGGAIEVSAGLSVGVHSLLADYAGDGNFNPHSSTVSRTVGKASSSTKLASSSNPSTHGHAVTFTATASPEYAGVPSGKITFKNGSTTLATVTMASGKATYTTSSLAVGTHSITSVYSGDGNFKGSISAALSEKVN